MEIPDIKARLTIQTILQHYGLKPERGNLLCCPFHQDKTPSLQLYPRTNSYHCFGCGKSGDVIQFIEDYEQLSKREAILKAKSLIGPSTNMKKTEPKATELSRVAVLTKFYQSARKAIAGSERVRTYATERGLDWQTLKLGFVSEKIPTAWTKAYRESALQVGLLIKTKDGRYLPRFKNCLLFPLLNDQQQVTGLYGRSITQDEHRWVSPILVDS